MLLCYASINLILHKEVLILHKEVIQVCTFIANNLYLDIKNKLPFLCFLCQYLLILKSQMLLTLFHNIRNYIFITYLTFYSHFAF